VLPRATVPGATLAHVGLAVPSIAAALGFYRDVLGGAEGDRHDRRPIGRLGRGRGATSAPESADGATVVSVAFGATQLELLEPVDPAGPIARFLAKRGPGIHHVCLRVPDLDAALARCRAAGVRLIDEAPRPGAHGRRVAFLHPTSTAGILVELSD
jgi:methylmalonyl-CoA epimerase